MRRSIAILLISIAATGCSRDGGIVTGTDSGAAPHVHDAGDERRSANGRAADRRGRFGGADPVHAPVHGQPDAPHRERSGD